MNGTLEDAFQHLVQDMYDSERRLLAAMPELRDAAQSAQLRDAIQKHIGQTQDQIQRLEQVAQNCGFPVDGETCQATIGLVKEAQAHLSEFKGKPAGDAVIIASAQKNEHYEIANYGCAVTWGELLGKDDCVALLEKSLQEEEETDDLLTSIAESEVNRAALGSSEAAAGKHGFASSANDTGSSGVYSQEAVKVI